MWCALFCIAEPSVIRHHIVDPMHALFLGNAKHTVKVWRDLDVITLDHLSIIQEKIDNMTPPPKVGRIPRKVQLCSFYGR